MRQTLSHPEIRSGTQSDGAEPVVALAAAAAAACGSMLLGAACGLLAVGTAVAGTVELAATVVWVLAGVAGTVESKDSTELA